MTGEPSLENHTCLLSCPVWLRALGPALETQCRSMGESIDGKAGISWLAHCLTHPVVSSMCMGVQKRQRHSTGASMDRLQCR